jgi:hypothetical protein
MKHIRKRDWMGCAIAAAATLANRTYEDVAAHWPDLNPARFRYPRDLCALLEAVTHSPWHFSPCWLPHPRLEGYSPGPAPVAVWIQDRSRDPQFGHWIVLDGPIVHDSRKRTPQLVTHYRLRDWVVTLVAKPGLPEELVRLRQRKRLQVSESLG